MLKGNKFNPLEDGFYDEIYSEPHHDHGMVRLHNLNNSFEACVPGVQLCFKTYVDGNPHNGGVTNTMSYLTLADLKKLRRVVRAAIKKLSHENNKSL